MSKKLLTLKELRIESKDPMASIFSKELKQAVRAWVEDLEKDWDNYEGRAASNENLRNWIKHFFNLEEEQ